MTVLDDLKLDEASRLRLRKLRNLSIEKDRHGKVRFYVRRKGEPKVAIWSDPSTQHFMREYREALITLGLAQKTAFVPRPATPSPTDERWQVYFIRGGNHIKIGTTVDVERRLKVLQKTSPVRLVLLLVVPGGKGEEASFHRKFASHRLHGEWFRSHPEITDFLLRERTKQGQKPKVVSQPSEGRVPTVGFSRA